MAKFEVTVKLYFNESDSYEDEEEDFEAKQKSFDETTFDLEKHLSSYDPSDFTEDFIGLDFEIVPKSAKWLSKDTLYFIVESYSENTTEEEIFNTLLYNSLEDGSYEGFDNGWVVPTSDLKYEYGLIDYRSEDNIKVKKI